MQQNDGTFEGSLKVSPATDLKFQARQMGQFLLTSTSPEHIAVVSNHSGAEASFKSASFLEDLERLSWDLIWEQQVTVQFELNENTTTTKIDAQGRQEIHFGMQDRMMSNLPGPIAGTRTFTNLDLLQRIRDHIVSKHVATVNPTKSAALQGNAAILVAVEHFIKGIVNRPYALAEFYSVYETIAHQWAGGKAALKAHLTPSKLERITKVANDGQLDLRHPPRNPSAIAPLPPGAVEDAAVVAKEIIVEYARGIV